MHLFRISVYSFQPFHGYSMYIFGIYRVDLWVLLGRFWGDSVILGLVGYCPGFGGFFSSLMGVLEGVFSSLSNY